MYTEQRILATNLFHKYVKMIDYASDTIQRGSLTWLYRDTDDTLCNATVWLGYAKLIKIKLYMQCPNQVDRKISISEMLEQVRTKFDAELGGSSYLVGLTLLIWSDISDNNIRMIQSSQMVEKKVKKGVHCMNQIFKNQINRKVIRGQLLLAHSCTTSHKYVDALRLCKNIETAMLGKYNDTHYLYGALFQEFTHLYRRLSDEYNSDRYQVKWKNWKVIRKYKLREDKEDVRQNWVVTKMYRRAVKLWPKLRSLDSPDEYNTYVEMARKISNC